MMDDKALGLLGIARRAGRLSLGHDAARAPSSRAGHGCASSARMRPTGWNGNFSA